MNVDRKLVAALACRNTGSRLYGKPVQNLDVCRGVRIIDHIIECLRTLECIDEIVLGISEGVENEVFIGVANKYGLRYIVGDEHDVLSRLIACGEAASATDIFRVTTESPFLFFEAVDTLWEMHVRENADATFMDHIIDGCGFEILTMNVLQISHARGSDRHRSEFCSLYIRENNKVFNIIRGEPPADLVRRDLRLTVDYPEDLVVCRSVFDAFSEMSPRIPVRRIVSFLDSREELRKLIEPLVELGYSTMYHWGDGQSLNIE